MYVPCYVSPAVPPLAGNKQHFLVYSRQQLGVMEHRAVFSTFHLFSFQKPQQQSCALLRGGAQNSAGF